jgi:hypothetical protein
MLIEHFIRGSSNLILITLTEDGDPITGAWTALDIWIADIQLHRTEDGDGISLNTSTGLLTITPELLTAAEILAIDQLSSRESYRVIITVTSALNDNGAVFGGTGSDRIFFTISDKPA